MEDRKELLAQVRVRQPVIHCITNYVTANDVANMLLAAGASPIMADGPKEMQDIASVSHGLVLNLGTLKEAAIESMLLAGRCAAELGHPVVLDPVGAGASSFRRETALGILQEVPCSVIRGNASEIRALMLESGRGCGVDVARGEALTKENYHETKALVQELARQTQAVIVMTGATDLVATEDRFCLIQNGSPMLGRITGAGCMLDGVLAAFLAVSDRKEWFEAAVCAVAAVGICGELAQERVRLEGSGTGSFRMHLMDAMSLLTDDMIRTRMQIMQFADEENLA